MFPARRPMMQSKDLTRVLSLWVATMPHHPYLPRFREMVGIRLCRPVGTLRLVNIPEPAISRDILSPRGSQTRRERYCRASQGSALAWDSSYQSLSAWHHRGQLRCVVHSRLSFLFSIFFFRSHFLFSSSFFSLIFSLS